jgi:streptogramin lyase
MSGRVGSHSLNLLAYGVIVILVVSVASAVGLGLLRGHTPSTTTPASVTQGSSQTSSSSTASCIPIETNPKPMKSQLQSITFGAVTKFLLPSPGRTPNAITVAPDGSVWFGELALPGVGHLFPNGTLIEYQWPFDYATSGNSCSSRTNTWGIALWDGRVWASDTTGNQLVGLDPANDSLKTVTVPTNESFPYTLTVAPDNGSLWFTELFASKVGELTPNGTVTEYTVDGGRATPTQIVFTNETLGYYVNVGGDLNDSPPGVFSFDPEDFQSSQAPIGGNRTLYSPDSLAQGDGGIWLAQHGASSVIFYNFTDGQWTTYPTSTVGYIDTTLPYFVAANGTQLWFNEHYANRMAVLNVSTRTLTEYSLANPPISNGSQIENALTFGLGKGRVWFTEWTANYVGFVDTAAEPSFSVQMANASALHIPSGGTATFEVVAKGTSTQPLSVQFSDSEYFTAIPQNLSISSSQSSLPPFSGQSSFAVTVEAERGLEPGNYTLLVTLNGGLVVQSAYLDLQIG